jgi:threonine synthase
MWRYIELLPVCYKENIVTMGEGFTPLIRMKHALIKDGPTNVWVKNEGTNPTGTFKARGMATGISKCKELGVSKIAIPSIGNGAISAAAYASRAGIETHMFVPSYASPSILKIAEYFGATLHTVHGSFGDVREPMKKFVREYKAFDLSTTEEPYRVEGKKTMGLEIIEQLEWESPDAIVYPTGGGTGIVGIWKTVLELERMELLKGNKRPKLFSVQSDACSPIVKAVREGKNNAEVWANPSSSIARGISAPPKPYADYLIIKAVRESGGSAVAVSDKEIQEAMIMLARHEGVFTAPEGAATLAAMKTLIEDGTLDKDMRVVLLSTGHGFIYPETLV